jgi:hypothetical protein
MNFLLILSAMLSAVTGAFAGGRAPEARPHHIAAARAETPSPERILRAARAQVAVANEAPRAASVFTAPAFDLPAPIPAYADRLIE